jgi:hypothetical protein
MNSRTYIEAAAVTRPLPAVQQHQLFFPFYKHFSVAEAFLLHQINNYSSFQ